MNSLYRNEIINTALHACMCGYRLEGVHSGALLFSLCCWIRVVLGQEVPGPNMISRLEKNTKSLILILVYKVSKRDGP